MESRHKYDLLEERLRAVEGMDIFGNIDARIRPYHVRLVPDLVIPPKWKVPELQKYDGTKCPAAHLTMFCRKMTGHTHNDKLLIHCFQYSKKKGSAAKWYNQLDRSRIHTWRDLGKAFLTQYKDMTDMAPDRLSLQKMEKKSTESFKEYAQRWRDLAAQVQPPLPYK